MLEIADLVVELDAIKFGDVVPCNSLVTSGRLSRVVSIWWLYVPMLAELYEILLSYYYRGVYNVFIVIICIQGSAPKVFRIL